jgi:hypothetical protein
VARVLKVYANLPDTPAAHRSIALRAATQLRRDLRPRRASARRQNERRGTRARRTRSSRRARAPTRPRPRCNGWRSAARPSAPPDAESAS